MNIVLASSSKFRRQALDMLNLDYEVIPSTIDEKSVRDNDPKALTKKLAEAKAKNVGEKLERDNLVIAGDLFVLFQDSIYEKPETEEEAVEMLSAFSGNRLEIISGVSVLNTGTNDLKSALGQTEILFRDFSKREIRRYVSNYPVLELAGAFEKEGVMMFSSEVHGDLSFLTGMPLNKLIKLLQNNGFHL